MTDKNTAALAADHTEHHLDMATAAVQGFRDGVASLAASAGELTPAHIKAMERAWQWMENQADGQSKGGHATFDLMMLRDERDALRAAIDVAAPPTAQAEGWRLVPVEPTQEMIDAMRSSVWLPACYRAMLAAAPCPPTSAEGVEHGYNHVQRDLESAAAEVAKLKGQRAVLCSLLRECLPVIDALMQMPGDDDSDARLNGLAGRIIGALDAIAEDQVKGGES